MKIIVTSLEKAVLKTLAYSSVFNYALSSHEVHKFLVGKKCSYGEVVKILKNSKFIEESDGFYFLKIKSSSMSDRKALKETSHKKMQLAKRIGLLISIIPTIKMVGITGSLSMENSVMEDDIDYLVIVSAGYLWITRFILTVWLDFLGIRRKPKDKSFKDKICLNMYLDDKYLSIFKHNRNLYSAHEVIQIKPIINKEKTFEKFLSSNSWVLNYISNALSDIDIQPNMVKKKNQILPKIFTPVEHMMYVFQKKLMQKNMTCEQIGKHQIFFHPRDAKTQILSLYYKTLDMLN